MIGTEISGLTRRLQPRIREADTVVPSVCPYCAVGCGQLIYAKQGKIIDIEGNPASPINGGTLCPKGSATYGFIVNPDVSRRSDIGRPNQMQDAAGRTVNRCINIASLGGATLDNEENYLIKKLFGAGLGMVWIENQARI